MSYVLTDHLGSTDVVETTDPSGTMLSTAQMIFSAWGGRREPTTWLPPVGSAEALADHDADRYGFTHQEMLDNVNLIHMNGRVYDPNLGRFLSVDPVFEFPTNTQSLNPYSYVLNNPLSMTDPTGYVVNACNAGQTTCSTSESVSITKETTAHDIDSRIAVHGLTTITTTKEANGNIVQTASGNGFGLGETAEVSVDRGGANGAQVGGQGSGDVLRSSSASPMGRATSSQVASVTKESTNDETNTGTFKSKLHYLSDDKEVDAEAYSEKTNATVDGYLTMISVAANRVNSKDKQYVNKGEMVNMRNVLRHSKAFQGFGDRQYEEFLHGRVSTLATLKVLSAEFRFILNGPNTDATFFIANPKGEAPTNKQVNALGHVTTAKPAEIGGIYLYSVKPPGS